VRGELDQLLVDEFQDTDPLQCEVIRWIALEGPEAERPGLFLVGDPKQSIYGWRSADLRAYHGFLSEILGPARRPERLSVNHRSLPGILEEVERVVAPVMRAEAGLQPEFQALIASARRASEPVSGPCVEYWVSWGWDADGGEPIEPGVVAARQLEARALARDLRARHERGELDWSDVGVLFRSTGDLEDYLQVLRAEGIPYAVERDRGYFRRREVIEATALTRCVLDCNDHVALLAWLRSASVGVPDAALLPLWRRDFPRLVTALHGPDPAALANLDAVVAAAVADLPAGVPGLERVAGWDASLRQSLAALGLLRASFDSDPADAFVEKLRTFSLIEVTESARFLGRFRIANLDSFFRDLLSELEAAGDRATLLRRLRTGVAEAREAEEARPSEAAEDAVRVMTIHKAKGLDFRHTYVVQLHKQSGSRGRASDEAEVESVAGELEYRLFGAPTLGFHAVARQTGRVESAERVRSLYVAMTRARDRLVLLGRWPQVPREVEPEQALCHLALLPSRQTGVPDLVAEMGRLRRAGATAEFEADGVRWVFPALLGEPAAERRAPAPAPDLPSAEALRAEAEVLREHRSAAAERSRRPWSLAVSADSHAEEREERAELHFGDSASEGGRGVAPVAGSASRRAAMAAGTAVHRILEDFDLGADPNVELDHQESRLQALIDSLAGDAEREAALQRARQVIAKLRQGDLLERLHGLDGHVVARELPLVLPPVDDADGPLGFRAGSIDLCYRDPDTAELVVVDYKTDPVDSEAEVAERVARYTGQGRHYQRALREALQLERDPRFELWFLAANRIEVVA
jgi:ATP-dependent helicase/nuclease subunit A